MKKFFVISFIFLATSVFMTFVFASMAGEQGMKNYFVNVIQDRLNCVDANWQQHKVPLMGADEIQLESVNTDIKIEPSGSGDIEIEFAEQAYGQPTEKKQIFSRAGNAIKFMVSDFVGEDEHSLKFNMDPNKGFNLQIENLALLVRVPKQIKKIKINTTSGDIKIVNLAVAQVELDSVSADVRLRGSKVENLKFSTYSGDLKFSGSLSKVEASSISGSLKFELDNNDSVAKIQTTSGDVKAEMKQKNGSWDVQTVSGDFKLVENSHFENELHDENEKSFESKLNSETKVKKCSDFKVFGVSFN